MRDCHALLDPWTLSEGRFCLQVWKLTGDMHMTKSDIQSSIQRHSQQGAFASRYGT